MSRLIDFGKIPRDEPARIDLTCQRCGNAYPLHPRETKPILGARIRCHCGNEWEVLDTTHVYLKGFADGWRARDPSPGESKTFLTVEAADIFDKHMVVRVDPGWSITVKRDCSEAQLFDKARLEKHSDPRELKPADPEEVCSCEHMDPGKLCATCLRKMDSILGND